MSSRQEPVRPYAEKASRGLEDVAEATARRAEEPARPMVSAKLEERLHEEPFRFQFFQAVRLLEQLLSKREPVGRFVAPAKEAVRFKVHQSLAFPASDIQGLEFPENGPPQMTVNFMGLTGPNGVLPIAYTVMMLERMRAGDTSLQAFFDLFNHRSISLLFRAWEKYRFTIAYERGDRGGFTQYLLDLIGIGTPGLQDRQAVQDDSLLFYGGLLSQRPRSAQALKQIVSDYFEVPVEIEQFLGSWYRLDEETQCCLDVSQPDVSERVGEGAVVGDEVWDPHARVRVKLGPLSLEKYLDFLPNGSAYEPLRAITRFFSNDEFDFEIQLILKKDNVPFCKLGEEGDEAPQLGWVTWMKFGLMDRNPQDTILQF